MADKKQMTKSQIVGHLSEKSGLTKVQINGVLDTLSELMVKELSQKGPMKFVLPGVMKVSSKKKPATKARKGTNPFTGEEMMFKAKPASKKVRALPLKSLKAMVN